MITKITHITLFVADQAESLAFYQKLGFIVHTDAQFGPMRWLTVCLPEQKDVELALVKAETDADRALVGKQASDKPFLSLESSDCHKDYERLMSQGVAFIEAPKHQPWGISAVAQDLSGNLIYMCQHQE